MTLRLDNSISKLLSYMKNML